MNRNSSRWVHQILIYFPLAGVLGSSFLNISAFQRQFLMLILLLWACAYFLYRSWLPN